MDIEEKQSKENKEQLNNISKINNINNLTKLKEKISNNQKKIHDMQLRHLAYLENIKKDAEKKIKNIKNIKKEEFFKNIIPIIDILEDTLSISKKTNLDKESLVEGIHLILVSLLKMIHKFGVKTEGKKNEIFNPKIHNVILTENSQEIQPDHVISVIQKGFSFNNIILRKASVIIYKV